MVRSRGRCRPATSYRESLSPLPGWGHPRRGRVRMGGHRPSRRARGHRYAGHHGPPPRDQMLARRDTSRGRSPFLGGETDCLTTLRGQSMASASCPARVGRAIDSPWLPTGPGLGTPSRPPAAHSHRYARTGVPHRHTVAFLRDAPPERAVRTDRTVPILHAPDPIDGEGHRIRPCEGTGFF
jgi:hypothetical protein